MKEQDKTLEKHLNETNTSKLLDSEFKIMVTQMLSKLGRKMDKHSGSVNREMEKWLLCSWDFPGKNIAVGCYFLLRGSSQPRDRTCISCTAGGFFTAETLGKNRAAVFDQTFSL